MKIFQVIGGYLYWQTAFSSLSETDGKFPASDKFIETEKGHVGWKYDESLKQVIPPTPPPNWGYDEDTDMFFPNSPETIAIREKDVESLEIAHQNRITAISNATSYAVDSYTMQLMEGGIL